MQRTNYKRDLNRVRRTISDARVAAWGPKMVQLEGRKKASSHGCDDGVLDASLACPGQGQSWWWAAR